MRARWVPPSHEHIVALSRAPKRDNEAMRSAAPMRVHGVAIGERPNGFALDGTPTDCVHFAVRAFGSEQRFDLVVSGINHGANIGTVHYYSGTVGAALEGLANGIPAIAVSQSRQREGFKTAAEFSARVVRQVFAQPLDEGVLLSINVPMGKIHCAVAAPPGLYPYELDFQPFGETDGDAVYKRATITPRESKPGLDVRAFMDGCITVTPLQLDRTHHPTFETIAGWEPGLESMLNPGPPDQ